MKVTVENLKKGNVIIVSSSKGLFTLKLLRDPELAKVGSKTTWSGVPRWKSVVCAIKEEIISRTYTTYNGKTQNYTIIRKVLTEDDDFNKEVRIDLTEKECWLIKK